MKQRSVIQFRRNIVISAVVPLLLACSSVTVSNRPTPEPVVRVTPGPTQFVPGTQTALAAQSIPTPTPQGLYVVKAGDTLGQIADEFETTVDEILAINSLADPNQIEVGQELIIPSLITTPEGTTEFSETATQTP